MSADPSFEEAWGPDPQEDPAQVFGPLLGAHNIEDGVLELLKTWTRSYVYEVCRRYGLDPDALPPIRSWRISGEMENMPEDQHPAVIVRSVGAQVVRRGGGASSHLQTWRWELEVGVQTVTRSLKAANNAAMPQPRLVALLYVTALHAVLVQKRDAGKVLGMIDVQGERYTTLSSTADRSTHLASVLALAEVPRVVEWGRGPAYPLYPPDEVPPPVEPTWPQVEEVEEHIQKTPLEESLAEDDPDDQIPPHA